jgi:hypothetical protein
MRRTFLFLVLCGLLLTPGFGVQDPPGGPPVGLRLEVLEAPTPWYVAGRPVLLKIVAVDQYGRPSLASGIVVRTKTSDPKSKLNNFDVGLVNGTATLKLQWFTPSDAHSIKASGTGGIKGETNGIKVRALPKGLKFKLLKPEVWPKYAWAGGYFKARAQLLDENDDPVGNVQISFATSDGTVVVPGDVVTDPGDGSFGFDCFNPEFVCPNGEGGNGGVNGDIPISVACFIDENGNGIGDDVESGDELPPITPVSACPQQLIPCALQILCILEEGGTFPPPTNGDDIIVTGIGPNAKPKGKERADLAKISAAKKFLQEQVVDFVNSGKWNGKFSDVRKRIQTVSTVLKGIPEAQTVVQRLECASELLKDAPDIHRLKLDVQRTLSSKPIVSVGFRGVFRIQSLGTGTRIITSFPHCFAPRVEDVSTQGPGQAQGKDFATEMDYECTGLGDVKVIVTITYAPERVTPLPPGDVGISATAVHPGGEPVLTFDLSGTFIILQQDCIVTVEGFEKAIVPVAPGPDPERFRIGSKRSVTFTYKTDKPARVSAFVRRLEGAEGDIDLASIKPDGSVRRFPSRGDIANGKTFVIDKPPGTKQLRVALLGLETSDRRQNIIMTVFDSLDRVDDCFRSRLTCFTVMLDGVIAGNVKELMPDSIKAIAGHGPMPGNLKCGANSEF